MRRELETLESAGAWGGPVYRYGPATLRCLPGGHVCQLQMPGHPLDGRTFGSAGTIAPLVDLWVEERRLPVYMRAVPPAGT